MASDWEEDETDESPADEDEGPHDPDADLRRDTDSVDTLDCPYCGRAVYDQAQRCPHCGRYISREDAPHRHVWWIVIGGIAALAAVLTWVLR